MNMDNLETCAVLFHDWKKFIEIKNSDTVFGTEMSSIAVVSLSYKFSYFLVETGLLDKDIRDIDELLELHYEGIYDKDQDVLNIDVLKQETNYLSLVITFQNRKSKLDNTGYIWEMALDYSGSYSIVRFPKQDNPK